MLESVSPFSVLIVDALVEDREARRRDLIAAGAGRFTVVQAGDASEALRCCRDEAPRCLVLAHRPPEFDAGSFLTGLHAENASFDAPIILVGGDSAWELARSSGVESVLGAAELSGERLTFAIDKAVETSELRRDLQKLKADEDRRADALHDAEERFSCFMSALAAGAWIRDLEGTYVYANKTLAFAMNRPVDQIVGQKAESLLPPEMAARRREQDQSAARSDHGMVSIDTLKIEGHPPRHLLINQFPLRDRMGVTKHVGGIGIDMSGMGNMVAEAPIAVAMFDRDLNYLAVSRRWSEEFGEPAGGFSGRCVHDLPPFMPEKWNRIREQVLAGASLRAEREFLKKADGDQRWYRWAAYSFRDHSNQPSGILVSAENVTAQKLAEDERRQIEQRYRIFFDNASFGAAELDLEGRFIKVNKCLCDMGGYAPEELIGRKASDFTVPEDHANYLKARAAHFKGNPEGLSRATRFLRKDGSFRWIRITPSLIRDENGVPQYSCGIVEDITESLKYEEALRQSEERMRHLIDNIPNSAVYKFTRDKRGYPRLIYLTSGVESLTGLTAEQVIANPSLLLQSVLPEYRSKYVEARVKAGVEHSDFLIELPVRRPDGAIVWVRMHSRSSKEPDGSVVWHGVQVDITERKLAELALARNEARLNAVLDGVHDGIISIDGEGAIQSINAAGAAMFGYERDELIGGNIAALCLAPKLDPADAMLGGYSPLGRANGQSVHAEGRRKDGAEFPLEVATVETRIDGAPLFVCFARDLSERRTIEAHMAQLKAQRLTAMGGMAAALAHELNQPLAAIGAHVETAQRLLRMEAEQRPFSIEDILDSALEQTIRAGEIISTLRQFAARGEPDKTIQSIHALIGEVRDAMRTPTIGTDREIDLKLEARSDKVFIDKVQIRQVLFNLIRNADESMQDVNAPRIGISTCVVGDMIRIDIADNGPGVSDEIREKLFEPLTTTKAKGMGIGLSLSRSIAEFHSGGLAVGSNAEGGATFSLTLPLIATE
jgi:two-component system sensor kinase FixL